MPKVWSRLDSECAASKFSWMRIARPTLWPKVYDNTEFDAKTTIELGLSGVNDEMQLRAASDADRVLVTNNICDFVPLHEKWLAKGRSHAGIVVFHEQVFSIGEIIDGWRSWFTRLARRKCETGSNG